jgi:hypothetical protein
MMVKGSALYARGQKLVKALRLVLEAYILFDADASGTIDKEEVLAMIREKGSGGGRNNALLMEDRWSELDWDHDGQITFKEFLFAFYKWVGVDDIDSDDEDADSIPDDDDFFASSLAVSTGGGGGAAGTAAVAASGKGAAAARSPLGGEGGAPIVLVAAPAPAPVPSDTNGIGAGAGTGTGAGAGTGTGAGAGVTSPGDSEGIQVLSASSPASTAGRQRAGPVTAPVSGAILGEKEAPADDGEEGMDLPGLVSDQ